jgi:hypothetical protein
VKLDRLRRGETIALVAAVLLFACMFFGWYGSEISGQAGTIQFSGAAVGGSAWQTLSVVSFVLMLTIVVAVGTALLALGGSKWRPAIPPSAVVAVLGGLSTLLVLFRILVPPDLGQLGGIDRNATLELGAFLGLLFAAAIAYGGYRAMGERGTSFAAIGDSLSRDRSK